MKRFYDTVEIHPSGSGYTIVLDARRVKTPLGSALKVPTQNLAEAIAEEWQVQEDKVDPANMPMTRLAYAALDQVQVHQDTVIDEIAAYAETDLVCFRADQPQALIDRQAEAWDPLCHWFEETFGLPLVVTAGVIPKPQNDGVLETVRETIAQRGNFELAALHTLTKISGSVVICLALKTGFWMGMGPGWPRISTKSGRPSAGGRMGKRCGIATPDMKNFKRRINFSSFPPNYL